MRICTAALVLLLPACKDAGPPFASPSPSEVLAITAQISERSDGGAEIAKFEVPKASERAILASLNGSQQVNNPPLWQVLGDFEITLKSGSIDVHLFWTREKLGAFRANGKYYRGGSDSEFIRLIEVAKRNKSERSN